jgi:chromosome segregation ATPase
VAEETGARATRAASRRSADAADEAPRSPAAGRGRPRIWSSEAERKRAYRERLARDVAEPVRLRAELRAEQQNSRQLRTEIDGLTKTVDRLRRELTRAGERETVLADKVQFLHERVRVLNALLDDRAGR